MEPAEELFDIENDPLELTNLATSPDSTATLQEMRKRYDQELAKWKRQAVDYNDYQRYGVLFDRDVPLSEKNIGKRKASGERRLGDQKQRRKEKQRQ